MSGPFGSSQWMYASGGFYNGVATQSLRFDDGSSAYLSRTPASAGNRKTWTWSGWVKRSNLGATHTLFDSRPTGEFAFGFLSGDTFYVASSSNFRITNQVFRDVSSWYHFVVVLDTTQATGSNRIKVYVNGNQITSFGTSADPSQNAEFGVNFTQLHSLGRYTSGGYFDGYMAEVNLIDGQALDPTSFGETKNGVWIAKEYTGSYGTNGFRLQFNQTGTGTASSSTIGADTSGNDNHFSSSGIVASDCDMLDSPENNFATFNTLDKDADYTLSEGNLKADSTVSGYGATKSTFAVTSGKWYWEIRLTGTGVRSFIGIAKTTVNPINATNGTADTLFYQGQNGNIWYDGSDQGSYSSTYTTNDIISVALNLDDNEITFYKNGTSGGVAISSIEEGDWTPSIADGSTGYITSFVANFGQDPSFAGALTGGDIGTETPSQGAGVFKYTVPSGYKALCTANISDDDLPISPAQSTQADDYFSPTLYTSDDIGAGGTQSITNVGFQPDWVWIKNRSSSGTSHTLFDSVRTAGKMLQSDTTSAEASNSQYGYLSSFDSDGSGGGGFTLTGGTTNANFINQGTDDYVSWNWKAGGTAVTNTQGDIQTQVSANTDAGFSIITYSGSGTAGDTIGHGLNSAPTCIHWKRRNATGNWMAYFEVLGTGGYLNLDRTNGFDTGASPVNGVAPTNSVITLSSLGTINNSAGTYVCYAFHDVDGYSKYGSYTGNDSTNGNFIFLGFRPSFVIIKYASGTAGGTKNWFMFDDARDTFNPTDDTINANASDGETADSNKDIDFLSNGFKIRNAEGAINNAAEYIYMAWASTPFKYANAR